MDIGFNIWDDYFDDEYVPEGEIQETSGWVESDDLTEEEEEQVSQLVYDYVRNLDLQGVEIENSGCEVIFTHLTHERRERLVEELQKSGLSFNGCLIDFYSES